MRICKNYFAGVHGLIKVLGDFVMSVEVGECGLSANIKVAYTAVVRELLTVESIL